MLLLVFMLVSVLNPASSGNIVEQGETKPKTIFKDEQIVFSANFNITQILVPVDGKYVQSTDIPSIFFTLSDPKMDGGSCIYVLEGFAAYEILEGGRDSTADYGTDKTVYFGAKDGMYRYDPETLSAKRYGIFRDDIIQLQKLNGSEVFYILTADHKMHRIENGGRNKTRLTQVICALQFVLDTSNNIYYISCNDNSPHIILSNGLVLSLTASLMDEFKDIKLLRPAFVMEDCIPFFGDDTLYILYSNGTNIKKEFTLREKPSAFSVDAALYLVAALNGKIYEFNIMDVLLKSMFGLVSEWPQDVSKMVLSMMESAKGSIYYVDHLKKFK